MTTTSAELPLFCCEFKNSPDKNLIAKFFRAVNAQDAYEQAKKWHGSPVTIIVTAEKE